MSLSDEERSARRRIEFLFGRPVAFHRCFVTVTGGVHAALILSQALYWLNPEREGESRGRDEGCFWKTREDWEAELGLSRWEQETARRQLRLTSSGVSMKDVWSTKVTSASTSWNWKRPWRPPRILRAVR